MNRFAATLLASALLASVAHAGQSDFDGDGRDDIAIGVPWEGISGKNSVGAVDILYGTAGGITAAGAQHILRSTVPGAGTPALLDNFGEALAVGDFDDDSYSDLAIGIPGADVSGKADAGMVVVLYGSSSGLLLDASAQVFNQNTDGVKDKAEADDRFGLALAAGDFDGDGRDDLAIGCEESLDGKVGAGAVAVLYGSSSGLDADDDDFWHQNSSGVKDACEAGEAFGSVLEAGDFDADGRDDLAIGVPAERIDANTRGAVAVLYGSADGLDADADDLFSLQSLGGPANEQWSDFGVALATGDLNGDGRADLAIGASSQKYSSGKMTGAVHVLHGTVNGLGDSSDQVIFEVAINSPQQGDHFGAALAIGDYDGDSFGDLAIGAPGDLVGGLQAAGAVLVLYGSGSGVGPVGAEFWHQDVANVPGAMESHDQFGGALMAGDFDGDNRADLCIGVPFEDVGSLTSAGAINLLYGSASGLDAAGAQILYQDLIPGTDDCQTFDRFGIRLGR